MARRLSVPSKCPKCDKPVYFAERKTSLGHDWHPTCLRCENCNKILQPGSHSEHCGKPFCNNCYRYMVEGTKLHVLESKEEPEFNISPELMARKQDILSKVKEYNISKENARERIKCREVDGDLLLEGMISLYWGLRRPIVLAPGAIYAKQKMQYRDSVYEFIRSEDATYLQILDQATKRRDLSDTEVKWLKEITDSIKENPPTEEEEGNGVQGENLSRDPKDFESGLDASSNSGEVRQTFTPPHGTSTNLRVTNTMSSHEVIAMLLQKYNVENSSSDFTLCVQRDTKVMEPFREDDVPLMVRLRLGPSEDIARIFVQEASEAKEMEVTEEWNWDHCLPILDQREVITFASTHGESIRIENGGQSAYRFKDNSNGIVVTSAPIQNDKLFQVEIMEMNSEWSGSLSIGVTALPIAQVISASKAKKLPGNSVVLTSSDELTVLYIGGQEKGSLPGDINLLALKVGDTVGLLRQSSGALHFFLNGVHMVKLPVILSEDVYGLVDLYGRCVKVTMKPMMPQIIGNPRRVMAECSTHQQEEELHAKAKQLYEDAMKLGSVKMSIIKCLVLGIAGVGKTHLKWLLLSKNTDQTAGRVSTGLSDNPIVVSISSMIAGVDSSGKWDVLDETELRHILASACKMEKPAMVPLPATRIQSAHQELSPQPVHLHQEHVDVKATVKSVTDGTDGDILEEDIQTSLSSMIADPSIFPLESMLYSQPGAEKGDSKLIEAFKNRGNLDIDVKLVHFIDSGGQPQFLELLPAFVQDVSAILFAINLSEHLDHCPMICLYGHDCKPVGKPFESPYSHMQVLEQCLRVAQDSCQVFVVGTHRDKEDHSQNIGVKNKIIDQINSESGRLVFKNGTEAIWAINGENPDSHDQKVAAQLRQAIVEHCLPAAAPLPMKWFRLELMIRDTAVRDVISYSTCRQQALSLGMDEQDLKSVLLYMVKYSLLLWYHKIDSLKEVVFCDPQVILKIITNLVQFKYELARPDVQQASSCKGVKQRWCHQFRDHAIVSKDLLSHIKGHFIDGIFTVNHFIELMCHLFVMAPLEGSDDYLMPALLDHKSDATNQKNKHVQPFRILLSGKSVPYGMFSRVVAFLLKSEDCTLQEQQKKPVCLHRNCVTYRYKKLPAVFTIVESTASIEVHLVSGDHCKVCSKIRKLIYKGIMRCIEVLKYSGRLVPKDGFVCCVKSCRHTAIPYPECPDMAWCSHCQKDMKLGPEHTVWITDKEKQDDVFLECSLEDIYIIAGYEFDWRCVGRRLLGNQAVIDIDIEGRSEGDKREMMLLQWKMAKSSNATYQALVKELRAAKKNATAHCVEELAKLQRNK